MRSRFPEFLVILLLPALLSVLLAGCAGFLPGSPARPTPVFLQPTPVPVHPFVPGVHRYVEAGDRLTIPAATPRPIPTPRPSPTPGFSLEVSQSGDGGGAVEVVGPGDGIRSCTSHYRQMLIDYRGRVLFGSHVGLLLSRELRKLRPDCVGQGWKPSFEADVVCVSGGVAGMRISDALTWLPHSLASPRALPTARDDRGNILVHFARLPLVDERGCWYYSAAGDAWAWKISGGGSGIDRPEFPACDHRLRELLSASAGWDFGPLQVARALDEVRLQLPARCGSLLWDIFPASGSHEDCGVAGDTGLNPQGFLVITWHENHIPADGAVCWALPPGSTGWEFFYPKEEK